MSERGTVKIIVIAGVFLAAIGGAAYWFFGVRAKDGAKKAAQTEIIAWETRLAAARECLFGKKPASSDSGEALAVRELTPDPWDRTTCTKTVGAIARGVMPDTGILPVEHAWMTLNRAAAKTATAFAVSKDPYGKTAADERRGVSDLPDALRELDKAHAELRLAAGLPPPATSTVPALPTAQIVSMLAGGEEVTEIRSRAVASVGTLVVFGETKSGPLQITLVPGAPPRLERVNHFTMRSVSPGTSWAAAGLGGGVEASNVDDKGVFLASTNVAPTGGSIVAVVGGLGDSLVAFAAVDGLVFARGTETSGKLAFTVDKPISAGLSEVAFDPLAGRALLAWAEYPRGARASVDEEPQPTINGVILSNGAPIAPMSLGGDTPRAVCLATTHGYVQSGAEVLRFDQTASLPIPLPTEFSLQGCGAMGALFADAGTTRYTVCTDTCRLVDLRGARPSEHAALAGDHVVSVAVRERVLAVWSEKGPPAFYRLPEKVFPHGVISDGKTIDILAESGTEGKPMHYVLVRVPAS